MPLPLFSYLLTYLIPAVITQIFNPTIEFTMPVVIPTKEAKRKIETHTEKAKVSKGV